MSDARVENEYFLAVLMMLDVILYVSFVDKARAGSSPV